MVELDTNEKGDIIIKSNGQAVIVQLNDINDVIAFVLDGLCALCFCEIPQEHQVCCECLRQTHSYHRNHHACIR